MSLKQPARLQVDPDTIPDDDRPPQTGTAFNLWYLKWSGGDSSRRNYVQLKFRVNIAKDSGYTRGSDYNTPICLFFARGCCYLGKKCNYLHRLPNEKDIFMPTQDCFGRDKSSNYNDDMSGVGSFNKPNRSLFVGGLQVNDNIEGTLNQHFLEFGKIERLRVLHGKSCAFITYQLECEAQFAREAMQNQSLDGKDVLSVNWANDDPDPIAQRQEKRRLEELAVDTVRRLLKEPKKQKVQSQPEPVVEEPEQEQGPEPEQEQKMLTGSNSDFFAGSNLSALKKLQQKMKQREKREEREKIEDKAEEVKKPQAAVLIGGYSSDEE